MLTLAQDATISFGAALGWAAGIGASIITALLCAAGTFMWRADKKLGLIVSELKHIVRAVDDHEDRLRAVEGRASHAKERERMTRS